MVHLTQSTKSISENKIKRGWHLIDMQDKILGRASSQIAKVLQGKHKTDYVPYLDSGDFIVVVNAKKVVLTGKKARTKTYDRFSGYPGGRKETTFKDMLSHNPTKIIRLAVSGMLPKNKLRDRRLARLFVFPDEKHPYADKFQESKLK